MKSKFFRFLIGISIILIFGYSGNKDYSKIPICGGRFIFTNESTNGIISQIIVTDNYQTYTIYNSVGGQVDTVDIQGSSATVCLRVSASYAGRVKFFDTNGNLVSCSDVGNDHNVMVCFDIDQVVYCSPYNFKYNDVSCPN